MQKGTARETQDRELKESWDVKFLKSLCAFANQDGGGVMIIGIADTGRVIGVNDPQRILKKIPDDIRNQLKIKASVKTIVIEGKTCIEITVEKANRYVDLRGVFYKRVGNTTERVVGEELRSWILSDMKFSWTDLPAKGIKIKDLSKDAINFFIKKGTESGRMSMAAREGGTESLLKNYELMDDNGLRVSGAVLFSEVHWQASRATPVRIGAFSEDGRLLRDDMIDGPVIMQPDRVMDLLLNKYIPGTNELEGLMMVTKYPYPEKALRESIMNAIVHRDHSSVVETYVRVYPDHVKISNPGRLPAGWTVERLLTEHDSKPANPAIAGAFFAIRYIEKYGTGVGMMRNECKAMNIPEPEYNIEADRVQIIFRSRKNGDITVSNGVTAEGSDLTDNESKIYELIIAGKGTKIADMSEASGISSRTVSRILDNLVDRGYIQRIGGDKNGKWMPVPRSK